MLRIAQYQTWGELQELCPQWNSLLSRSASDTIFLTWQWCEAWWRNYGTGREISVLAAWEEDNLVGLAPLYVEEARLYGRSWRRLRLIGDGSHDSDYLDCFAEPTREAEAMAAFAGFLEMHRESWDWMELNGPRQNSGCAAALLSCLREKGWKFSTESIPCATLPLPASWDDYLRKLDPRFRTKVRSSIALLNNYLKAAPVGCVSEKEIEDWLPLLFDLHTRRWAEENKPGVFRDAAKRAFYHDLSRAALEQGWLAFHRLSWGERPLALQYGLVYRNRFHLLQEGYDPAFSTIRPGVALRAWLLRHWIETGLGEYDFLAGVAPHKLDWGAKEKSSSRLLISANRAGALVALDVPSMRTQARKKLGSAMPAGMLSLRRRIVSTVSQRNVRSTDSNPASRPQLSVARLARQFVSLAYSSAPVGRVGRSVATNYTWSRTRRGWSFPIHRRPKPVLHILQYHRVNNDGDPFLGGLPVDTFRAQMKHVVKNFPLLTLDQVAGDEHSNRHPYSVAVTFDDGYRDNFVYAFPILKELGIPATVFLATSYIDSERLPWYDQLRLAFKLTTCSQFTTAEIGGPRGRLNDLASRLQALERTLLWLRGVLESERRSALDEVYRALDVPSDLNLPNQMLRWEDVRQMSKHNISFGAHTVTHPVLSKVPAPQLPREILGSKQTIENRLQMPVSHFAYPFGQSADFNAQAKRSVQEAGFKTAVTTLWGLNEPDDDLLELKRFTPWEADPAEFKLKLDWYRLRAPQKEAAQKAPPAANSSSTQEVPV